MSDLRYMSWLRALGCDAASAERPGASVDDRICYGPIHAHHSTGLGRGKSTKNSDHATIPLCMKHHSDFHSLTGLFRDWDRERIAAWQHERSTEYRCRYLAKDCF
jgi:hypothetical protein